tara:strand:- start:5284 stop:5886 length:603 start_codon:yes stop_codon:yes gene_type:complete
MSKWSEKNRWGGGNRISEYTPLSEVEQEAIARMVDAQDMVIHILGWGKIEKPQIIFGDLRVALKWRMNFSHPEVPTPMYFLDLELRTRSGVLLFKERQSTMYDGKPVQVCNGVFLDMAWDIAVTALDPKIVKMIMPFQTGFTSRFQDKDTGEITLLGNNSFSAEERSALRTLRSLEEWNRQDTKTQAIKATKAKAKNEGK